jgi:hypothetical protein
VKQVILTASILILSNQSFAVADYKCSPLSGVKPEILSIVSETKDNDQSLLQINFKDKTGVVSRKDIDADRSLDQEVIYFTTDESILVINPQELDPGTGGIRGLYITPPTQEQIPVICQNLL